MSGFKADAGKERFDLIPPGPLLRLADLFTKGSVKYSARNWEAGMRYGKVFSAMMRHAWKFWGRIDENDLDPQDLQHHLDSVAWCAIVLREFIDTHPECDDRPRPSKKNLKVMQEILDELNEDAESKHKKKKASPKKKSKSRK